MKEPPPFLLNEVQERSLEPIQRPASGPRRGEWIAWLCAGGAALGTALWALRDGEIPALGVGLIVFFGLAAALISFGNWIDRNTWIHWTERGIDYHSPLRTISLPWDSIETLWAVRTADSWRVGVRGGDHAFAFRTGGAMRFGSSAEMQVGFSEGESLAAMVQRRADLGPPTWSDGRWLCERDDAIDNPHQSEVKGTA